MESFVLCRIKRERRGRMTIDGGSLVRDIGVGSSGTVNKIWITLSRNEVGREGE